MLNHKRFKIYFEMLCNCETRLPKRIRTYHNTCRFTQIAQIIFEKPDLLLIDDQIQRFKEYLYSVMIKNLVEIVLFSSHIC